MKIYPLLTILLAISLFGLLFFQLFLNSDVQGFNQKSLAPFKSKLLNGDSFTSEDLKNDSLPLEIMFGLLAKSANFLGNLFFTEISEEPFKSPIKQAVSWGVNQVKALIHTMSDSDWVLLVVSVIITLVMLFSIVKLLRSMVLSKVEAFFDKYIFKTVMRSIAFGFCLTVLVQSSSITTSVIVPLAGAGVLSLRQIFPFTLGANIGTTITSIMAALVLNPIAMVVAFSHLLFNVLAIVIIYPIKPLRDIPLRCAEKIAELSVKNKMIPLLYLGIVFVLIPITIILLGG